MQSRQQARYPCHLGQLPCAQPVNGQGTGNLVYRYMLLLMHEVDVTVVPMQTFLHL